MSIELTDQFKEGVSNCCGAKVYEGDRCAECKENCGVENEESEEEELTD